MRTSNYISYIISPIEKIIKEKLIPAFLDGFPLTEEFRKLLTLPCKLVGMGKIGPNKNVSEECSNSREPTSQLAN